MRLSPVTLLRMSKPKSKTRRASHLISRIWFSLANSWRMATICQTTISKKSPPYTWCFCCEMTSSSCLSTSLLRNTTGTNDLPQVSYSLTSLHCQLLQMQPNQQPAPQEGQIRPFHPLLLGSQSGHLPKVHGPGASIKLPFHGKKKKEINQLRDLMSTWASILMRSQVMFVKIKYRRFYMKKENTKDEVLLIWLEGFFLFIFKHSLRKKQ